MMQKRDVDISKASDLIEHHIDRIAEALKQTDTEFDACFVDASTFAESLEIEIRNRRKYVIEQTLSVALIGR